MKIYIMLPFASTTRAGDFRIANLTHDYKINFKTTSRYRFKKELRMGTYEKDSGLSDSPCRNWIYTPIDPKTLRIYQEGE